MRLSRRAESQPAREERLEKSRTRDRLSRSQASSEYRDVRLAVSCARVARSRALESDEHRNARQEANRARTAKARSLESNEVRNARLAKNCSRNIEARSFESNEERDSRSTADRVRHCLMRSLESAEQHEQRLSSARQRYHDIQDEVAAYSSQERNRIQEIRQDLTNEQRDEQLESDRLRHAVQTLPVSDDESIVYENSDASMVFEPEELPWISKERSGFCYNPYILYSNETFVGSMSEVCPHCRAFKWKGESKGMCCSDGKVRLEPFLQPQQPLKSLLYGDHPESRHFLKSIRAYNSAFQMTSFGAKQVSEPGFMPTFKVQGQEQANVRQQHVPNLNSEIVRELQTMLHTVNPYVASFKSALESVRGSDHGNYKFVINADRRPAAGHLGRYNAPSTNEVAVLLVDQECDKRDVVLRSRENRLQRISETHRAYDALQYPLMFCHGEDGYNFAIHNVDPHTGAPNHNKKTSALQFYSYMIQLRQNEHIYLHRFKGLFSQFLVDMYAKIETERLVFIRTNQRKLRAESSLFVDLRDAIQRDSNADDVGRMVILPSTFTGGPRYMHERTQDAFCYVRKFGGADLFITFTTNPKWPEIVNELLPDHVPSDRHDLVSRVFHLKQKRLIDLLTKDRVFGAVRWFMYSIEWQKRGLPHSHNLLWFEEKIRPDLIDQVISAELPNPDSDPALYDIVKTNMIHGPCGTVNPNSPCMKDAYRRRPPLNGEFTAEVNIRGQSVIVDNRWVVPHSPVLSRAFQTHINVESCASVESIKYICKYVNKGSDQATFGMQADNRDEVTNYQSGRYISTSEAVWRTLSFPIHERHPTVMHLDVHLENGQRIYFDPKNLCQECDFAKSLLYDEVPSYYTYDKQRGVFNRRRRGQPVDGVPGVYKDQALGRVYTVHPNNSECYYLRLLLLTSPRINRECAEETNYSETAMAFINDNLHKLTYEQKVIYEKNIRSVEMQLGEIFFLDAPGGTGKTFLTSNLLAEVRRHGKIALAVASSGIAATLLPGGKTAHTTFKIPIDVDISDQPVCSVSRNSDKAKVIQDCSLIVWDECTMAHKKAIESVNRMLQDIRRNNSHMGGVTILFCGDFRQTLPVVTRGTRADEVNACLKRSVLWPFVQKLNLTQNMRAHLGGHERAQEFSDVLLRVGEGRLPEIDGLVHLPDSLCKIVPSVDELICRVYDEVVYYSINTILDQGAATTYPVEFLNSLSASGLPAHTITLKVGVPIMLLRNLTPPKLCNGTRLKVVSLQRNLIEAEILTGCAAGEIVFISRIPLIPHNFPFQFKRIQFPVSVCFAMTINKSQGQTLRAAGIDLRTGCFSHGQLYVACSRVTSSALYFLLPDEAQLTKNVVYSEVL
ncbi:hypothetical protein ABMA27_001749 [Loxostege sticticalis]|uniref:ATP-dependent DNA helicase n=1 Tax=Loxostege sticticalis TaxID=481309 RepID=A0ABR3HZN1_LOXSC